MKRNFVLYLFISLAAATCFAEEPATPEGDQCCPIDGASAKDAHQAADDSSPGARIASMVVCPQCPGTLLANCETHRDQYIKMLDSMAAAGKPDDQILAAFAQHFGVNTLQYVLAHPVSEKATAALSGTIVNASQSNSPARKLSVRLESYNGSKAVEADTAATDDSGAFSFEKLPIGKVGVFRVSTVFAGQTYTSPWVVIPASNPVGKTQLPVYETTTDTSALVIAREHLMMDVAEGAIHVSDVLVANNTGTFTILPTGDNNATFHAELPEGATDIQLSGDFQQAASANESGVAFDKSPFPPGSRQYVLQYTIPVTSSSTEFARKLSYRTMRTDFIFPEMSNTSIRGENFDQQKIVSMGSNSYQLLSTGERPADTVLKADIMMPMPPVNVFRLPALALAALSVVVLVIALAARTGEGAVSEDANESNE